MYTHTAYEKYVCLLHSGDLIPVGSFEKEFETVLAPLEDWESFSKASDKASEDLREIAFQKMCEICDERKEDFVFLIASNILEFYTEDFLQFENLTSNKPDDISGVSIKLWLTNEDEEEENNFKELDDLLEKNPNSNLLNRIKICLDEQIEFIKESSF
jgi:hypothetical protein